jgi:hypothetical protein
MAYFFAMSTWFGLLPYRVYSTSSVEPIGLVKVLVCISGGTTGLQSGRRWGTPWIAVVEKPWRWACAAGPPTAS